jgi:CBS domain-containing protein
MAKTPIVRNIMKKASRTFRADEEMAPCMSVLARSSFAAMPVLDDDGLLVGVLSEKDVMRTIIDWAYDQRAGGPVRNYMSRLNVVVTPDMDLLTAARAFLECDFSCLPVMENEHLVGRVTRHEVLKGIEKWATEINRERAGRLTQASPHERPSAMGEIQKVAASHTREQMARIFRRH